MQSDNASPTESLAALQLDDSSTTQSQPKKLRSSTYSHVLGFVLVSVGTWLACQYIDYFELPILATLGVASGYYTLLACWLAYGKSIWRWPVCLALATVAFLAQVLALSYPYPSPFNDSTKIFAIMVPNATFLALKYGANLLLILVSKIEVRHYSQSKLIKSFHLRFGIGELMLATAFVAALLGLAKLGAIAPEVGDLRLLFVLALIGLFHFILFWPILLACLSKYRKWFYSGLAILTLAVALPMQVYVFYQLLEGPMDELIMAILSLDLPYLACLVIHLGFVNYQGYSLVVPEKASVASQESSSEQFTF